MPIAEPLRFRPLAFKKVWGGEKLLNYLPDDEGFEAPIGEVWELVDRDGCSSIVDGGKFDGRSLSGLMLSEREALIGRARASSDGHFPLLVKLLDAAIPLSVQVHPDSVTAERLKSESKDECWYVLDAELESIVYLGLKEGVDAATFASRAVGPAVVDLLQPFPVRAGEYVRVPAGTVHAIGGGLTLIEIQDNADTTYRMFDWGRPGLDGRPRTLHREEALQSIHYDRRLEGPFQPEFETVGGVNERACLWETEAYKVEMLRLHQGWDRELDGLPIVYVVIRGSGCLRVPGVEGEWRVARGNTWLVPADVGVHRFEDCDGELEVLAIEARD